MFRLACLAAALLAALLLGGCQAAEDSATSSTQKRQPTPVGDRIPESAEKKAEAAPRPVHPLTKAAPPRNGGKGAGLGTLDGGGGSLDGKGATKARPMAAEKAERPRPAIAAGAPAAAAASAALSADEQRMQRRDEYVAGLKKGAYTFNPPSPIKVDEPITVALWVDPGMEAAQLAEEMKKAFPESAARVEAGATTWSPRMRATLTGVDFEITPIEGKDFNGTKGLSVTGRTEWGWTIVPTSPGKKKLHLLVWVVLPPALGEPRELPQVHRDVEVEVTVWWLIDHYWEKYWKWILSGLGGALAAAIGWWWKKRFGGGGG